MSRASRISEHIAASITRNRSRKTWAILHAEALQKEYEMETRLQVPAPEAVRPVTVVETDSRVIEGSHQVGDHRQQADHVQFPTMTPVRAENNDSKGA